MRYIIDRFEGEFAVCELEDMSMVNIPKKALPSDALEGDSILVTIDSAETEARKKKIGKLMDDLFVD